MNYIDMFILTIGFIYWFGFYFIIAIYTNRKIPKWFKQLERESEKY